MSPLETRQSLIVRLKSEQNELAWRDFVCAYEGFLNQLIRRQGVPERHVPDITQQILLTIAQSIDGWTDDGNVASFRRWLSTVSRNVVIRLMSRERKQAGGIGGSN
jgi:RNA polymerase sigma-70 factor (ECF subfamily)